MRVVLDTNIIVSALLTGGTAPRRIIRLCLEGALTPLIGAALYAEYEDVLGRRDLFKRSVLDVTERDALFDALISVSAWTPIYFLWRPNLPDAGDDHLIELAVAGGAEWIVTANLRDLRRGELRFPYLSIGTADDFLKTQEPSS
ncbi:putative toxin-antitoxin system toxin component, PIN family [Pukyongiella litopenaei]|uniref:Putative toxin-antitoxin system toxin component, PIN family n=1 Tax=Pukyongiella litopenaei TaxID=2605946 RepID=A0A5C2H2F9_9RHOB|nr:putative toxin-antitoxin system toxin component, PIN family [Pukyongiella litopenaei]QEP30634.1 putative toxin-antitoxin system toxin component, PIN family [Pukyongiella litopenaei]